MGMTIDEHIANLVRVKHYASPKHYETLDAAIDTMRKYQKIEEIVKFGNANELGFEYVGEKITEVVEE